RAGRLQAWSTRLVGPAASSQAPGEAELVGDRELRDRVETLRTGLHV
ncbi:MAG: hypothetical protein JWP18_1087, partial [Solirubrobacterales bacterium]|nr:hypothetical protein [Solirubrobacterales bacterium]